ncbi:hypothetical protein [Streptomyces sp.]|uniref:hypothetical protein n=1 Tax=Streptomyces sp. TaxID=1931 RepID=UPI0028128ACF|nr:hypothetical protein [Streptomyces sp.]
MTRPRCPRGHFLPATGDCRCTRPRATCSTADLYGQGLTLRQLHSIRTVTLTGSYL